MQKNKTCGFVGGLLGPDATEPGVSGAVANFQCLLKALWGVAERLEKDIQN